MTTKATAKKKATRARAEAEPKAPMTRAEAKEYSESLGQIHGGGWRQIAWARRMGVPEALGLTFEDWVQEFIGGHVRLSIGDRREAVKELTADGLSQREVGEVLGVHQATVAEDLHAGGKPPAADDSLEKNGQTKETAGGKPPRPPIPKGSKTPHEEAANDPGVRWHRSLHDLYVLINSVCDLGGIKKLARKWSEKSRRQTVAELKRIVAWLQDYITYFSEGGAK
jgi:hypothetical protein